MAIDIPYKIASSGGSLTMPQCTIPAADLDLKRATNTIHASNSASFYSHIGVDFTAVGWDSAVLSHTADTTEQTIVDITSSSGVLTNVISPRIASASGTITIRVTIDGVLTTFTDVLSIANSDILLVGDRVHTEAQTTIGNGAGYGAGSDIGWDNAPISTLLLTPVQVIERGLFGMPFTDSLKVTVQGSANLTATSSSHRAVATYALDIPKGL